MARTNEMVAFAGQFQSVVQKLSERLGRRGISIVDAIAELAQSGSEAALDKIADVLVELMPVFSNTVNYDNPRWKEIRKSDYTKVNENLRPEHFPVQRKRTATVFYEYLTFNHNLTTQEVLDVIKRRKDIRRPDRAETEDFLDAHPKEKDKYPVIGFSGSIVKLFGGICAIAYVSAGESYRSLDFSGLGFQWSQECRFLVVRESAR